MSSEEPAPGEKVLLDANIFVYHFAGRSRICYELVKRCELGELSGYTTQNIIIEVLHRLMILEAIKKKLISGPNPARKLREKHDKIRLLTNYHIDTAAIEKMGIKILSLPLNFLELSQDLRARYGLLVNDSITVAVMKEHNIINIATADSDFARVRGLRVFTPSDL